MTETQTNPVAAMRAERRKHDPLEIVREFEDMFGQLTLTERKWLVERIAASQVYARR